MILKVNSIKDECHTVEVALYSESGDELLVLAKEAHYQQAEVLLPLIQEALTALGKSWSDISAIEVVNQGGSFSSLRVGVLTANALAYALGVPVRGLDGQALAFSDYSIVPAVYDREPNIGPPKSV